jgi:restriction system protein
MPVAWLVRAGRGGELADKVLVENRVLVHWDGSPNLTGLSTQELERGLLSSHPAWNNRQLGQARSQLLAFRDRIQIGDLVAVPRKENNLIAVGRVIGDYSFDTKAGPGDFPHFRTVEWINKEVLRSSFDPDIQIHLRNQRTVCLIDAYDRVASAASPSAIPISPPVEAQEDASALDLEGAASDRIVTFLLERFKRNELTYLISAILRAQGFVTDDSVQSGDGGVDILAGQGLLGFESPTLCVQVKSGKDSIDVKEIRALLGAMSDFGADQGLYVTTSKYTAEAVRETRKRHFKVRLWTLDDIVESLQTHYDKLDPGTQAKVPLKQIWTLVEDQDTASQL